MSIADRETYKPTYRYKVTRHISVHISYNDENNVFHENILLEGITAVVVQHEIDHLFGILIDDVCVS